LQKAKSALKNITLLFCIGVTGYMLYTYLAEGRLIIESPEALFTFVLIGSFVLGVALTYFKINL
jgi:hypothetical protein